MKRLNILRGLALVLATNTAVLAQDIKIPNIIELSGGGAASGNMWKNGSALAVEEINAKGGVMGRKIVLELVDTGSDPGKARAAIQRALDDKPAVIFGPIFSGSVNATLKLTDEAKVPQIIGGEAGNITAQGSKHIFRTSFGQNVAMPKLTNYLKDDLKIKEIAIVFINNDFGKGGRDAIKKELESRGIKVVAEMSTEPNQTDYAADIIKLKGVKADAAFVYLNEDESARFLIESKKQGVTLPLIGETTLIGAKVVDLAGASANGASGHVGLTVAAPIPALQEFGAKYRAKYGHEPDHNAVKGYIAPCMFKVAAEKAGKFEGALIADALRGITIAPATNPCILVEASWDQTGEIDRVSFLAEIKDGKQVISKILPKLNK